MTSDKKDASLDFFHSSDNFKYPTTKGEKRGTKSLQGKSGEYVRSSDWTHRPALRWNSLLGHLVRRGVGKEPRGKRKARTTPYSAHPPSQSSFANACVREPCRSKDRVSRRDGATSARDLNKPPRPPTSPTPWRQSTATQPLTATRLLSLLFKRPYPRYRGVFYCQRCPFRLY
jgi:hypothetical protein